MRDLLFISHRAPYPPDKGERIRAWHVLNHLARDWRVHLGFVDDADALAQPALLEVCASVGGFAVGRRTQMARALLRARPGRPLMPDFYHAPALQAWVDGVLAAQPIALAYIYTVAMSPYLDRAPCPTVLDAVDIDSEKWAEYAATSRAPARWVWAREARTLLAHERRAAARADRTLFVAEPEAARFRALAPEVAGRVEAVENGVDLAFFTPDFVAESPFGGGRNLVFTGHMDYRPNIDAVAWFAQAVLPGLRSDHPDLRFWVVGANPAAEVRALASQQVLVTGRVPDVRPYLAHADAAVCPLRIARGIQNKVLEAAAMGRPVIASAPAALGIRAEPGRDLLVADDAAGFARAVRAVLAGRHPGLGAAARLAMERGYAWDAVLTRLDGVVARASSRA